LAGFTRGDGIGGETQEAVAKSFDDRIEAAEKAGNDMEADYLRAEKARVIMTRAEIGRGFPTDGGPEKVPSPAVVSH
jgi:isocitrate dehydrogenase